MFVFDDIALEKLSSDDLNLMLSLKLESWNSTHNITIANIDDQKRWFESLDKHVHSPKNLILMADDVAESAKVAEKVAKVGVFKISNVDYISRSADVAWDVFKEHRKKGIGKRLVKAGAQFCFKILNLRRLNAEILENNIPSQKCAEHVGFVHEGTKRESVHKNGSFIDSRIYGLIKSD